MFLENNNFKNTDLKIIKPQIYKDFRGYFYESYNTKHLNELLKNKIEFVQDNVSKSKKWVIRGLHYQKKPFSQAKLIRVIKGKIFDVAVDLRKKSKNYGKYFSVILSAESKKQIWIPEGYAHGFLALTNNTEVQYKTTQYYSPRHEITIRWNDRKININWPLKLNKIIISKKDQKNSITFAKFKQLKNC